MEIKLINKDKDTIFSLIWSKYSKLFELNKHVYFKDTRIDIRYNLGNLVMYEYGMEKFKIISSFSYKDTKSYYWQYHKTQSSKSNKVKLIPIKDHYFYKKYLYGKSD